MSCLAGSVRRMRTAWRKSAGRYAARPRWLPSPRAALRRPSLRGTFLTPAPSRRQSVRPLRGPPLPRGRARAGRSPCRSLHRTAPAPAWSPLRGTAAPGRPRRGDRTGRRRVVRQASRAEQPAAVSHRGGRSAYPACEVCVSVRSGISRLTTAARASKVRMPFLAWRWTSTVSAAVKVSAARRASSGGTPSSRSSHTEAVSRSASPEVRASTASTMSSPVGIDASRRAGCPGSRGAVSAISRNSASLPVPVGAALAYDTFGCGVKPPSRPSAPRHGATHARRRAGSHGGW
ncbi:hypothetical protein SPURM210S_05571 [Streptomyces purpurascens]